MYYQRIRNINEIQRDLRIIIKLSITIEMTGMKTLFPWLHYYQDFKCGIQL